MKTDQKGVTLFTAVALVLFVAVCAILGVALVMNARKAALDELKYQELLVEQNNNRLAGKGHPKESPAGNNTVLPQIATRNLDSNEYQLVSEPGNLATVDGPITVKELLNCQTPDLSVKCPDTVFIGKQNCNSITHAPADCAYDGQIAGKSQTCIYQEFGSVAAGTELSGYDALAVRNSRCFLIHWETFNPTQCMESATKKCLASDLQNGDQMLSTFKFSSN